MPDFLFTAYLWREKNLSHTCKYVHGYMCVGTKMYLQITTDTTTLIKVTFCKFLMTFFIAIWML